MKPIDVRTGQIIPIQRGDETIVLHILGKNRIGIEASAEWTVKADPELKHRQLGIPRKWK